MYNLQNNKLFFICLLISSLFFLINPLQAAPKIQVEVSPSTLIDWQQPLLVTVQIPKDHHAYLDRGTEQAYIPLVIDPKKKLAALSLVIKINQQPLGSWDETVQATVLRGRGIYSLDIKSQGGVFQEKLIPLEINYQLCNDITHVCYRPQLAKATFIVDIPTIEASWTEKITTAFEKHKYNTQFIFGLMLIAGLLSVATPCVYPMLPITSLFIASRGTTPRDSKKHALVYTLGIVSTYMLLGLFAGLSGGAFNSLMQSATVNLAFAIFFTVFGIALLGVFEFSFMQNSTHQLDQKTTKIKGVFGTWLMGSVAGLVISPCVGPIVFAVLLQVSDNIAMLTDTLQASGQVIGILDKLRLAAQGSLMMAGFGLGVGIPFLLTGVIKFKLPKAGTWMNKIKYAFGLVIIYFAYGYFIKGMTLLGIPENTSLGLALGMVSLWIAIMYCNVLSPLSENSVLNDRFYRFCGVLGMLLGGWLILSNLQYSSELLITPTQAGTMDTVTPVTSKKLPETHAGIHWYRDYETAQKAANESGKPIFIDFYAAWCANCVAFSKLTETNDSFNRVLRDQVIALKLVDKEPDFEKFRTNTQYRALKIGLPFFAVLSSDGEKIWSGSDYQGIDRMIKAIQQSVITDKPKLSSVLETTNLSYF